MLRSFKYKIAIFLVALTPFFMVSCDEEGNFDLGKLIDILLSMLGWNKDKENTENVPDVDPYDESDVKGKSKESWEDYFPAIGDQGSYGTCVAWATAYAMKTALNKKEDKKDLISSPIDLWNLLSVTSGEKSLSCGGSNFDPAFEVMINKGVASMSDVPFTNKKMTCDGVSGKGNSNNKLKAYRIIAYTKDLNSSGPYGMSVANFKGHLLNGPIAIGARLGQRFMEWNNSSTLSGSDTEKVNGQHAYHALVVVGFDDNKNAFRVRNSWGTGWGDNGSIWIDYDFFINHFCFGAWIASNKDNLSSSSSFQSLRSGSPNDLQMEILKDYETADGNRVVEYDIKNTGSTTVTANNNWSAVYLLFRKNRLSEKYVLFHDFYGSQGTKGKIASYSDGVAVYPSGNTVTNIDIVGGSSVAETMNGKRLAFEYTLPLDKNGNKLNGDFYMALIADAFGNISESDKTNNLCILTGKEGEPIKIVDGKITNIPTQLKDIRTLVSDKTPNNYSGIEIQQTLQRQFEKGMLKKLVQTGNSLRSGKVAKRVK